MNRTAQLMDRSAGHLQAAARAAEWEAGDAPAPELRTLAALARATAALISNTPDAPVDQLGVDAHLAAALDKLDTVDPVEGPADLALLAWHVHDLRRLAAEESA